MFQVCVCERRSVFHNEWPTSEGAGYQHKSGHFAAESFERVFFFFFFLFFFFFRFLSPRHAFLVCAPLCAPHPPSCFHYRKLGPGHWPWTLTPPVISHIPGLFPPLRPQTAHHSSLPPSPPLPPVPLFVPVFFFLVFFFTFPLAGSRMVMLTVKGLLLGDNEDWTASAAEQQAQAPPCQPLPWPTALSISLWNDLKLMSKWWCQLVKTGRLVFRAHLRQANSPNSGQVTPKSLPSSPAQLLHVNCM